MKIRRQALCLLVLGVLIWFLMDAQSVRAAALDALELCAASVIPALFPFLVVSTLLLKLGFGEALAPWLAGLMEPLFRVPGHQGKLADGILYQVLGVPFLVFQFLHSLKGL